ncbi:C6 transcription factor [Cordyceps fumosorosea ARSEF 2679]|uniref:C6 transcription factor n=1 Tax=Cordyceps fumosorosea (strain ARSEF 2679) TaxID=1081104 RepID=A0A167S6T2_CORFA|nr:C6 transcription factor [Cordyceps fumosorosea ARSEF 2679]OAA59315.1 C6 transcription factor [Cordyceps fumosorosea ARSEF 2679]
MDMNGYSSGMLPYADPGQFDYGSFLGSDAALQFQDLAPPHNQAALTQSPGQVTPPSSESRSPPGAELARRQGAAKQRLERRGHTKSRRGCYNCKRRRIKCQETHPACGHCVKTGLKCEYPAAPQIIHQPHHQIPLFSLQDMRFFQHFLTQCYPHHPLKQEEVWTHDIPCIAHNHEFLMHAILGFAASELVHQDASLVTAAMNHRVKAIKAIKRRLAESSRNDTNYEEANALVATCFALTFQSVSLEDGMAEYMTFIRGIVIIGMQMSFRNIAPVFTTLFDNDPNELLAAQMEDLPLIERAWVDAAVAALDGLKPLCATQLENEYREQLLGIVEKLYENSFEAYKTNSRQYGWWMLLPHGTFQELINMRNQTMLLLHTHWIALSQIMAFITEQEMSVRQKYPSQQENRMDPGFLRWLKYLNARVDYEHQMHNQWPLWVEEQLDRDLTFFGRSAC